MICSLCNKEFTPTHNTQKYCSKECAKSLRKQYNDKYQNSTKGKVQKENYYQNNKDKIIKNNSIYAKKNRKKINQRNKLREKIEGLRPQIYLKEGHYGWTNECIIRIRKTFSSRKLKLKYWEQPWTKFYKTRGVAVSLVNKKVNKTVYKEKIRTYDDIFNAQFKVAQKKLQVGSQRFQIINEIRRISATNSGSGRLVRFHRNLWEKKISRISVNSYLDHRTYGQT